MLADHYDEVNYLLKSHFFGFSPDFYIAQENRNPSRQDITVSCANDLKLWGQLLSKNQLPLALVKVYLVSILWTDIIFDCQLIGETVTDPSGFYLFELTGQVPCCYQVVVHSKHRVYNKIINPLLNPCKAHNGQCAACQRALLHYLNINFPNTFCYEHFITYLKPLPIVTTLYSLPQYK